MSPDRVETMQDAAPSVRTVHRPDAGSAVNSWAIVPVSGRWAPSHISVPAGAPGGLHQATRRGSAAIVLDTDALVYLLLNPFAYRHNRCCWYRPT